MAWLWPHLIIDKPRKFGVRYLFIGKSGAVLLGFPDTTQDADLFVDKSPENGRRLTDALKEIGFALTADQAKDIERGKDFVQLKNGPFDLDLVFAPDGSSRMPGDGMWMLKAFPSAIWTILSLAK